MAAEEERVRKKRTDDEKGSEHGSGRNRDGKESPCHREAEDTTNYQAKNTLQKKLKEHTVILFSVSDSKCECVHMRQHRELPTMKL